MSFEDIIITTTQNIEGYRIRKYIKPIAAHVVAGTNIFSEFAANFTDIFGGRSGSYEKQLKSLYKDAIEKIKYNAYEMGANAIVGFSLDIDEISGKGMSMFMITVTGTPVITEKKEDEISIPNESSNVSIETLNMLKRKRELVEMATQNTLIMDDTTWDFVLSNEISEIFDFLIKKYQNENAEDDRFKRYFLKYIESLDNDEKIELIYKQLNEENIAMLNHISNLIKELHLFDIKKCFELLQNDDFEIQKIGIRIATYDKIFYNKSDITGLENLSNYIENNFKIRGKQSTKKQILSAKEKDVWICECGRTNKMSDEYCICQKDIYGFKESEIKPKDAIRIIKEKIELIKMLL
jgi:uncharacterized protein YbjQ (UPF0145 family)